jgi:methionyl aminopeptidase
VITLKTPQETAKMREAGRIVAEMLAACRAAVRPGVTTAELDRIAADILKSHGAASNFKGYGVPVLPPFPGVICTSVNEQVVHGIPGKRRLKEGEILSIDAGAIVDGWHGDGARTFYIGDPPERVRQLIELTRQAMHAGIAAAVPGNHIEDISAAVEDVATGVGFGIIRQFVGHGIGTAMHEEPQVPNYRTGRPGRKLEPGICLAIEPMFTLGGHDTRIQPDDWTVVTRDGSLAAHFEHSIAVTADGPQILTQP